MTKERLTAIWNAVYAYGRKKYPKLARLGLTVGCRDLTVARRVDPRAFMHTGGHARGKVCSSPAAAMLSTEHLVGLFLHELGHNIAAKEWRRSEQEDADKAVRDFLGVKIKYRGPLLLEWVTTKEARRVLNGR